MEVDLQCGADIADMHWEEMDGVELYIATATCIHETLECNTTTSTCQFSNLHCGEIYEFSVTAFNNGCFGETSTTLEINTGIGSAVITIFKIAGSFIWCFTHYEEDNLSSTCHSLSIVLTQL